MSRQTQQIDFLDVELSDVLAARRIARGQNKAQRWLTETWVIYEKPERMVPVLQAEIYKPAYSKSQDWLPWTASHWKRENKKLVEQLASRRNEPAVKDIIGNT